MHFFISGQTAALTVSSAGACLNVDASRDADAFDVCAEKFLSAHPGTPTPYSCSRRAAYIIDLLHFR